MTDTSAIIVCAGSSMRMNGVNKILAPLGGSTVIGLTLKAFEKAQSIAEIVVVCRDQDKDEIQKIAEKEGIKKLSGITQGGIVRQASVRKGLAKTSDKTKYIAIHDGARPLVDPSDIEKVIREARKYGGAALGVPVKDTVKIVEENFITDTPYRPSVFLCQTPQVFSRKIYTESVSFAEDNGVQNLSDDCQLVEALGYKVFLTQGSYKNIKITTPDDLIIAEAYLEHEKN